MKNMGKKATTAKTTAPVKRAAKPSAAIPPAAEKKTAARAKPATAVAVPKRAAKPLPSKAPGFTSDDVALRAYFIAEKRRRIGLPGDEGHDWLEAERQILSESKSPKKVSRTKAAAN